MRSYDASTRTDLAVPFAALADIVAELSRYTDRLVVIGAVARDLLASGAGGLPIMRATTDVDVAVAIDAMERYGPFGDILPGAAPPTHVFGGMRVDVIPFGQVERDRAVLFDNDMELDVTGMAEAAADPVSVTLPGGATVPVASLAAQSVLKLVAWKHRGTMNVRKDAQDFGLILFAASSGVYEDDVWDEITLPDYEYDLQLAGAHRLGRDASALLHGESHRVIEEVLVGEEERDRLVRAMNRTLGRQLCDAYAAGFGEGR